MRLSAGKRVRSRSIDDALLPLVNVVFLPMIFFLSAGRLGIKPEASAPEAKRIESRAAAQVLELRGSAQLVFGDELVADAELPGRALLWRGQPLDLKAPGQVPADRVLRLLAVLRAAGVNDVRLLTIKGGG